jgi:CDGSH-type Zn-finger protein
VIKNYLFNQEEKMMDKAIVADNKPIEVQLEGGETYYWCRCGKSGTAYLCQCKQTKTPLYCDRSHAEL